MIYVVFALIILDALKDALYDNGKKFASGTVDIFFLSAMICGVVLMQGDWIWIVIYILLRYALFDLIYNITRKLPLLYLGNTKFYDRVLTKFPNVTHFLFITKLMALISAGALIYQS